MMRTARIRWMNCLAAALVSGTVLSGALVSPGLARAVPQQPTPAAAWLGGGPWWGMIPSAPIAARVSVPRGRVCASCTGAPVARR